MKQILLFLSFLASNLFFAQDGTIDPSYNIGTGFDNFVYDTHIQIDDKLIAVGDFFFYNGIISGQAIRLNTDGTRDTSFDVGGGLNTGGKFERIKKQADGKFILGGVFTQYDVFTRTNIIRINNNGTLDESFDAGATFNNTVKDFAIQSDGKIIVVGFFTGTNKNRIIRLNSNGTIDTSFNVGTGFNNTVWSVSILSDGKIIVTGAFSSYNGTATSFGVCRLNQDGTLDTTFNSGTGADGRIDRHLVQADGKIVIVGSFTNVNSNPAGRIARLNTDGSIDGSFNAGTGANDTVYIINEASNNKMYISGFFATYNGVTARRIIRLNSDGSRDTTFDPGTSISTSSVSASTVEQSDNKIILAGTFVNYQGVSKNKIVRIGDISLSTPSNSFSTNLTTYPNPISNELYFDSSSNGTVVIYDLNGRTIRNQNITIGTTKINFDNLSSGIYFAKVTNDKNETKTVKLIKQ